MHTRLGWVLSGPIGGELEGGQANNLVTTHVLKCSTQQSSIPSEGLEGELKRFWELESLGINAKSVYEELVETIAFKDNRYEVQLPWKRPHPLLPDNYDLSLKRLNSLIKRLRQDPELLEEYDSVIREQLNEGIVGVVEQTNSGEVGSVHYIPHHAVVRRDKSTTKLRIVYDASAKGGGPSLNDCLYVGPALTQSILDIVLRFRVNQVALAGDIEKAFLNVSVASEDRDALRFLWVDDIEKDVPEIIVLQFNRVVFGVSSSPFLLNATIKHHIEGYKEDPEFVKMFLRSIYVDDVSLGAKDCDAAYELYVKSKVRLAAGGFNLRKFVTNSGDLRERINCNEASLLTEEKPTGPEDGNEANTVHEEDETYAKSTLGTTEGAPVCSDEQKILGVRWNFNKDELVFDMEDIARLARETVPSKRNVISVAAKFYDPLGFVSPVIVQFKLLFQELCKSKLDWDDVLEGELKTRWQKLVTGLQTIRSIVLPRCYFGVPREQVVSCALHGFCDASAKAYGAVIYLHITTTNGSYVRFLVSRTRVAPIAQQTIPRLELLSALILARLVANVESALAQELTINRQICWTDSKVALYWIRGEDKEWKQFVQNRVNEIRSLVPASHWKHCPGKENPADIPSRGMSLLELSGSRVWRQGPEWLSNYEETTSENGQDDEQPPDDFFNRDEG